MRHLTLIAFLIGHLQFLAAQTSPLKNKVPKQAGNLNCVYKQKFSVAERSRFYPFNMAATIKLASFRYHENNYPIKNGEVITDSLIELKTLTEAQTADLTDILYNNLYKSQPNYGLSNLCFIPRNAILFLDQSGEVKDYILICFHCETHRQSSKKLNFGDECLQKMEKLRDFFVSTGIQFGTDKNVQKYPGETFD